MAGLLCGLILTLWIGFGQPKPKPPFKPLSVKGCSANASLIDNGHGIWNWTNIDDEAYFDGFSNVSTITLLEDEVEMMTVLVPGSNTTVPGLNNTVPEER